MNMLDIESGMQSAASDLRIGADILGAKQEARLQVILTVLNEYIYPAKLNILAAEKALQELADEVSL